MVAPGVAEFEVTTQTVDDGGCRLAAAGELDIATVEVLEAALAEALSTSPSTSSPTCAP